MYYQNLKRLYEQTDVLIIKANLRRVIKENKIRGKTLQTILDCSIHTVYSYTKDIYPYKPELINLLIIAEYLKIDVEEFFK